MCQKVCAEGAPPCAVLSFHLSQRVHAQGRLCWGVREGRLESEGEYSHSQSLFSEAHFRSPEDRLWPPFMTHPMGVTTGRKLKSWGIQYWIARLGRVGVGGPNRRTSGCREHLLLARNPLQSHLEGLGQESLWMGAALLLGLPHAWL